MNTVVTVNVKSFVPSAPPTSAPDTTIVLPFAYPLPTFEIVVNVATPPAIVTVNCAPVPEPLVDF